MYMLCWCWRSLCTKGVCHVILLQQGLTVFTAQSWFWFPRASLHFSSALWVFSIVACVGSQDGLRGKAMLCSSPAEETLLLGAEPSSSDSRTWSVGVRLPMTEYLISSPSNIANMQYLFCCGTFFFLHPGLGVIQHHDDNSERFKEER